MVRTGSSSKKPFVEIATLGDDGAGKTTRGDEDPRVTSVMVSG